MIKGRYDQQGQPRMTAGIALTGTSRTHTVNEEFIISTGTPITLIPQRLAEELDWVRPAGAPREKFRLSSSLLTGWSHPARLTLTNQQGQHHHLEIQLGIIPRKQWDPRQPPTMGMDVLEGFQSVFFPKENRVEFRPSHRA